MMHKKGTTPEKRSLDVASTGPLRAPSPRTLALLLKKNATHSAAVIAASEFSSSETEIASARVCNY